MRMIRFQTFFTLTLIVALFCLMTLLWDQCGRGDGVNGAAGYSGQEQDGGGRMVQNHPKLLYDSKQKSYYYGPDMPLIFVGGFPRSGTTLMRAMLDAHPDIRCGEETRVIPRILGMRSQWKRNEREWKRLIEAGVNDRVIDSAITWFILEVIAKHGQPAKVFCNKDPFALKSTEYLSSLFPNSKYVLMIRDGRGTVHSMISRGVTVTGFDLKNPRQCLEKWNQAISQMYHQCYLVGEQRCFPMYYEQLVLHPEKWMKELTKFLQVPWNESVLHHELFIGDEISLSKTEKSTDQVVKPVNTEALTKWVGKFPEDVVKDMAQIAPMLSHLGYDPKANPPNYGKASDFVLKKTEDVVKNAKLWEERVANVYNGTVSKAPQPEAAVLPSDANQSSNNSTSDNNNISNSDNNNNDNNNNISVTKEE